MTGKVAPATEVVYGDALEPASLGSAMEGVDTAYYLIHSLGGRGSYEEKDRQAARNFARAAESARVRRIVYVGGLGCEEDGLSVHLRSRQEVGRVLRDAGRVPVIELRASIVIGVGSLSFEMIRSLVEHLPLMVTPKWVSVEAQPIFIEDLLDYMVAARSLPGDESRVFEVGGADHVSYEGLMRAYARCRKMRVRMLPVPVLTPHLSSLWLGLVTPLYARVGRRLIDGVLFSTIVRDHSAESFFDIRPIGIDESMKRALEDEDRDFEQVGWYERLKQAGRLEETMRRLDRREVETDLPPERVYGAVNRMGGENGWHAWNWLWSLRGRLDRIVGGVGMRRGRPSREWLEEGDQVDFWRVEIVDPGRRIRFRAEMKVPGRAWLEFEVRCREGGSTIVQTAMFDPKGLWGRVYWCLLYPLHHLVFGGMIKGVVAAARGVAAQDDE